VTLVHRLHGEERRRFGKYLLTTADAELRSSVKQAIGE